MPTAEEHRQQAAANKEFYDELIAAGDDHWDWALTVLFYAVVHEIGALLADNRATVIGHRCAYPPAGHRERKAILRAHRPWNALAKHYEYFEGWSRKTRYECLRPDAATIEKMEDLYARILSEIAAVG